MYFWQVTKTEMEDFVVILTDYQWFEHVSELGNGLYLNEKFVFSNLKDQDTPSGKHKVYNNLCFTFH